MFLLCLGASLVSPVSVFLCAGGLSVCAQSPCPAPCPCSWTLCLFLCGWHSGRHGQWRALGWAGGALQEDRAAAPGPRVLSSWAVICRPAAPHICMGHPSGLPVSMHRTPAGGVLARALAPRPAPRECVSWCPSELLEPWQEAFCSPAPPAGTSQPHPLKQGPVPTPNPQWDAAICPRSTDATLLLACSLCVSPGGAGYSQTSDSFVL